MPTRVEIKCINKANRTDAHERIQNIGGINANGTRWKMTQPAAVAAVDAGTFTFFVNRGGRTVDVEVAVSRYGHRYLKTVADNEQPDNLLSLPECP